ncbi:MAG: microcin ABC transporter permease, partial [Parvibaculum sp.]
MAAYILRRILLMVPTILGIMFVSFVIVQFAPGGPVEQIIAKLSGTEISATARFGGGTGGDFSQQNAGGAADQAINSKYRGAQGLDPK